jgi:hypothetical protein
VEEAALLVAVQRIIGRVEVENDLSRWRLMCLEEQADEQAFDCRAVVANLMVDWPPNGVGAPFPNPAANRRQRRMLEPVERALARQRGAVLALGRQLAGQRREHRVVPQVIVVDQILVPERDAEHPLRHHGPDAVLDLRLGTAVGKTGGEPPDQTDRPIGRAKQQPAGVRGVVTTVKRGNHLAPFDHFITEHVAATLCRHRGIPPDRLNSLSQKNYRRSSAPMHLLPVRNPG